MAEAAVRGRFVWHELMTTDVKSAADFYAKVIGWKAKPWAQDSSYTTFTVKKSAVAGLMILPEDAKTMGTPPNWLTYIGTADVDSTAREAVALGGKILKEATDIATVGRFAVLQDPQGAVFALFTPTQAAPPDSATGAGDFSWHELATTDGPAAFSFYQRLFGWQATGEMDMGPQGKYQMFGWNGKPAGGIYTKSSTMPGPPNWLPYIRVADTKKAVAASQARGARIINGPMEVPGGDLIAQGLDLQGAMFAVHSAKPVAVAAKKPATAAAKKKTARPKPAKKRAAAKPKKTVTRMAKAAASRRGVRKKGGSRRKRR
jgi:predicted enzyme related to lactoylglutathione lyase